MSSSTPSDDNFLLRWNGFSSNLSTFLRDLQTDASFCDVHLIAASDDDDKNSIDLVLPAHRVVLASISPFFRSILSKKTMTPSVIYLRGVRPRNLRYILDFVYRGEVSVPHGHVQSFLKVGQDLRISGLYLEEEQRQRKEGTNQGEKPTKKRRNPFDRPRDRPNQSAPLPAKKPAVPLDARQPKRPNNGDIIACSSTSKSARPSVRRSAYEIHNVKAAKVDKKEGSKVWICPSCGLKECGNMICCDKCDNWYHWPCVGVLKEPKKEQDWFCPKCEEKGDHVNKVGDEVGSKKLLAHANKQPEPTIEAKKENIMQFANKI